MKNESKRDYYLVNGKEIKTSDSSEFESVEAPYVYEVIRVIDGVALFEEGHIERLKKSIESLGFEMKRDEKQLSEDMKKLIEINKVDCQNIKIIYAGLEADEPKVLMFFVESHYPAKEVYETGIKTILFQSERENPNAKVMNTDLRSRVAQKFKETGAFEALLVDDNGYITEGSRSNFFFIDDGGLYTPPAETVLLGITRQEVIASANDLGIELQEKKLKAEDIGKLEGVFITGTSNDALPIRYVDDIEIKTVESPVMQAIMKKYAEKVENYIKEKKQK